MRSYGTNKLDKENYVATEKLSRQKKLCRNIVFIVFLVFMSQQKKLCRGIVYIVFSSFYGTTKKTVSRHSFSSFYVATEKTVLRHSFFIFYVATEKTVTIEKLCRNRKNYVAT